VQDQRPDGDVEGRVAEANQDRANYRQRKVGQPGIDEEYCAERQQAEPEYPGNADARYKGAAQYRAAAKGSPQKP
jgi:hypothetical protein